MQTQLDMHSFKLHPTAKLVVTVDKIVLAGLQAMMDLMTWTKKVWYGTLVVLDLQVTVMSPSTIWCWEAVFLSKTNVEHLKVRRDCMISWWFVWEWDSYWQICLEWECIGFKNHQCGALKSHKCVHYDEEYRKVKWLEGHSDAEDDGEEVKQFNNEGTSTSSRSGSFGFWFFSRSQNSCRGSAGFWFFSGSWNSCRGLTTRLWFFTC